MGHLIEAIVERENILRAYLLASRGRRVEAEVRAFAQNLDEEVMQIQAGLRCGDVALGHYHRFRIRDPEERLICAPSFRERVIHHAIMQPCEPVLDRALIHHTYACRRGRGQSGALGAAQRFGRQFEYVLKLDIRKYFDSVDHRVLLGLLERRFKEPELLALFSRVLATYETAPTKGLPIGSLTSQHFANFYLNPLDRFVTETQRHGAYVRYMDDFVVWNSDRRVLVELREAIETFLSEQLQLRLKQRSPVHRVSLGLNFLGYRLFPGQMRLTTQSKRRFIRKYRNILAEFENGELTERTVQRRLESLFAFVRRADTFDLRSNVIRRFGDIS